QRTYDRVVGYANADRASLGILQPFRHLSRRRENEGVRAWCECAQGAVLTVVDTSVARDLRQIPTYQCEVVAAIRLADTPDAFHRLLVPDQAAERVAGIRGIDDDAAVPDGTNRLARQTRLGVERVDRK